MRSRLIWIYMCLQMCVRIYLMSDFNLGQAKFETSLDNVIVPISFPTLLIKVSHNARKPIFTFRPGYTQTSLLSYRQGRIVKYCLQQILYGTFRLVNNKGDAQTAWMCRQAFTFVDRKTTKTGFLPSSPCSKVMGKSSKVPKS